MEFNSKKIKKVLIITASSIFALCVLIIVFISPITQYVIEKYSVKYTGRKIKMDWAYVNPFTGYFHFNNFRIYEDNKDTLFLSMKGLSISVNLIKILEKEYEITSITLDKPVGIAIQKTKSVFNFTDIIDHFSSSKDTSETINQPLHFCILNMKINDGTFYLRDTLIHINYFIKNFNFSSPRVCWNVDSFPAIFSFSPGIGTGHIHGNYNINIHNNDYHFFFIIQNLNLSIIGQYLKAITNYGTFSAYLDANINTQGNFKDGENSDTKGRVAINDFHFGKTPKEDYLSFDTLVVAIKEINPKAHVYRLDSITLAHPYFKYEKYDSVDNVETVFGQNGANISSVSSNPQKFNLILTLAHYLSNVSKNFFESKYKVNKFVIAQGNIKFNDYSTIEEFSIGANPLYIMADSIDKSHDLINLSLKTGMQPYGDAIITASVNPHDSASFDLNYHFEKIPATVFNPYLISYTSFPLYRGTIDLSGAWKVRNGFLKSENHILVIDPFVAKRFKNKDAHWIPLWLIMYFVRNRSNVIDYQIPITGNLKDPKFHLHDIVLKTLRNIFVKPPTTPYGVKVKALENEIGKSLALKWSMRQSSMTPLQEKFIRKMADFMAKNPDETISISPQIYEMKEKEYILFFEAKKKYYLICHLEKARSFSKTDSECVEKMSVKDQAFVSYLDTQITSNLVFTIQEKCAEAVGENNVNMQYARLNEAREKAFLSYFIEKGIANKVTFSSPQSIIPYNGFSFYKIEYKGQLPKYLEKAYKEIDELNNEFPREKYKKERAKVKNLSALQ